MHRLDYISVPILFFCAQVCRRRAGRSPGVRNMFCGFRLWNQFFFSSTGPMHLLPFTLIFFTWNVVVKAGSVNNGGACTVGNSRLQAGTYQFYSDCDTVTYCSSSTNTCELKGCRRDDFPFGYAQDDPSIPAKCAKGEFCPDEEDACQPLLAVGSACQLNRDGRHSRGSTHIQLI